MIVDKTRIFDNEYIISVYKDNQLVIYLKSCELQNKLDVSTLQDGEYLVVLDKNGTNAEQKLFINNKK